MLHAPRCTPRLNGNRLVAHAAPILTLWAAATLLGCAPQSLLDPSEPVEVTGALSAPDGLAAEREVVLDRLPDGTDIVALASGGGTACMGGHDNNAYCENARFATTDASGNYRFDLIGADTQSAGGFASNFILGTVWTTSEDERIDDVEETTAKFYINQPYISVPTLHAWLPEMTLEKNAAAFRFSYTPLQHAEASNATYEFTVGVGTIPIATATTKSDVVSIPLEVMADYPGTWRVHATHKMGQGGVEFELRYRSRKPTFEPGTLVPLSRDASCTAERGGQVAAGTEPCKVTDGSIATQGGWTYEPLPQCEPDPSCSKTCDPQDETCVECPEPPPECDAPELFSLDLGEAKAVRQIVLHGGEPYDGLVELSVDGETWTNVDLGAVDSELVEDLSYQIISLPSGAQAQFVRFTFDKGMRNVHEVDVF